MKTDPTYRGPTGQTIDLNCEWCEKPATKSMFVGPGRYAGHCDDCKERAERFRASVDPQLCQGSILIGTAWVQPDKPDLVIHHPNRSPITIQDHRQLKAKALKELLPPAKLPRKTKAKKPATAAEIVKDIARRRRDLDRDLRKVLSNPEGMSVAEIAEVVGMQPRQLEQLVA